MIDSETLDSPDGGDSSGRLGPRPEKQSYLKRRNDPSNPFAYGGSRYRTESGSDRMLKFTS